MSKREPITFSAIGLLSFLEKYNDWSNVGISFRKINIGISFRKINVGALLRKINICISLFRILEYCSGRRCLGKVLTAAALNSISSGNGKLILVQIGFSASSVSEQN